MLELATGSRLHFGLMELAADQPNRFAGLGLMVEAPQLKVRVCQAASRAGTPPLRGPADPEVAKRVQAALAQVQRALGRPLPSDLMVDVPKHPALHSGLGLGTQLAAAVATAACLALEPPVPERASPGSAPSTNGLGIGSHPAADHWQAVALWAAADGREQIRQLAQLAGRGKRSAIGLHGFLYGGLIRDLGYDLPTAVPDAVPDDVPGAVPNRAPALRPIATRSVAFPRHWPVVLILSVVGGDVHGAAEENLMAAAAATPNVQRCAMLELSEQCIDRARSEDFGGFVTALEQYMTMAASLFEPVQSGRYRDAVVARRVELARGAGLRGVGQSSWGPTVFGFAADLDAAQRAADTLRSQLAGDAAEVLLTQAADHGAQWRSILPGVQHAR
ncbi:MAG: hypothetical protein ACTHOU_11545 [Aureliella sp.]